MGPAFCSLILGFLPIAAAGTVSELKDAIGDSRLSPAGVPSPDLRAASATAASNGRLLLRARFARGTFDRTTTFIQFQLLVGARGTEGDCPRCGYYLVDVNGIGTRAGHAEVRRMIGDSDSELTGTVPIRVLADGVDVAVPGSLLAAGVPAATYRVVTSAKLDATAVSIILDTLPDDGMASVQRSR
jgi:hypothetical protein